MCMCMCMCMCLCLCLRVSGTCRFRLARCASRQCLGVRAARRRFGGPCDFHVVNIDNREDWAAAIRTWPWSRRARSCCPRSGGLCLHNRRGWPEGNRSQVCKQQWASHGSRCLAVNRSASHRRLCRHKPPLLGGAQAFGDGERLTVVLAQPPELAGAELIPSQSTAMWHYTAVGVWRSIAPLPIGGCASTNRRSLGWGAQAFGDAAYPFLATTSGGMPVMYWMRSA